MITAEYDLLEAGPETDAMIAREVMGWQQSSNDWRDRYGVFKAQVNATDAKIQYSLWRPSTDDYSAFQLVDLFAAPRWRFQLDHSPYGNDSWFALISRKERFIYASSSARTRQLAICRVALAAVQQLRERKEKARV